ncbi:hypothetical protein BH10BDE1_BH10BDE1_18700 [soil metagenome]
MGHPQKRVGLAKAQRELSQSQENLPDSGVRDAVSIVEDGYEKLPVLQARSGCLEETSTGYSFVLSSARCFASTRMYFGKSRPTSVVFTFFVQP